MSKLIVVSDWDARYENERSRQLKQLKFVYLPIGIGQDDMAEFMDHPRGAELLGAWTAILWTAGASVRRGELWRSDSRPHDAASLARLHRPISADVFELAIARLAELGFVAIIDCSDPPEDGTLDSLKPTMDVTDVLARTSDTHLAKSPKTEKSQTLHMDSGQNPCVKSTKTQKSQTLHMGSGQNVRHSSGAIRRLKLEVRSSNRSIEGPKPRKQPEPPNPDAAGVKEVLALLASFPQANHLPPPDETLALSCLNAAGGDSEAVFGVLKNLSLARKAPGKSWGWFPVVIANHLRSRRSCPPDTGIELENLFWSGALKDALKSPDLVGPDLEDELRQRFPSEMEAFANQKAS